MTRPTPRMILASEWWPGASARGLVLGFRALGWAVEEIDERRYLPPPATVADRIAARLRRPARIRAYNRAIRDAADRLRPQVLLTVKGTTIAPSLLRALRQRGVVCVNYYPDYHFNDIAVDAMRHYDLVATTKSFQLASLELIMPPGAVAFLHHGYSDGIHRPLATSGDQPVDVLYVGHASPAKAALLIPLARALPDLNLRVVGNGWLRAARGTALARAVAGRTLSGDFYAAEIARAKIVLAFHMGADPRTGFADLVSTRTFEIPACGGFMLHVDNDEVRSLYDVPSEIDIFTSPDDLIAKVRHWLAHPHERQAIAARGHARAVPAYGYTARAAELAALIEPRIRHAAD